MKEKHIVIVKKIIRSLYIGFVSAILLSYTYLGVWHNDFVFKVFATIYFIPIYLYFILDFLIGIDVSKSLINKVKKLKRV